MKSLSNIISEKFRVNQDTDIVSSYISDIFEVTAIARDINSGRPKGHECIARFTKKQDAEKYKEAWEKLYKEHEDNKDSSSPCWIDYAPKLEITEGKIFNHYDEEILIKQYNDDKGE